MTTMTTRGASFQPGVTPPRTKEQLHAKPAPTFDKKAWHRRKADEARKNAKQLRQIESCYAQHVPPQIKAVQ